MRLSVFHFVRPISVAFAVFLGIGSSASAQQFPELLAFGQHPPSVEEFKNSLAPNVGSPDHAVDKILQVANLKPGEVLYDLGSGDGRILLAAAKRYQIRGVGIEIAGNLARQSAEEVKKEGLQKRIKIIHGNFLKVDLSEANVVTLYLTTSANESLRPNLEHYLKPSTRVISYDYPIPGWKAIETSETDGYQGAAHTIYLYQIPASLKK